MNIKSKFKNGEFVSFVDGMRWGSLTKKWMIISISYSKSLNDGETITYDLRCEEGSQIRVHECMIKKAESEQS